VISDINYHFYHIAKDLLDHELFNTTREEAAVQRWVDAVATTRCASDHWRTKVSLVFHAKAV